MARAKRRLNATAMALSIAAHAVVLTALALHAPRLTLPREEAGPPEPIIPILIMPRTPPAPPGTPQKPRPIRLHRRQLQHEPAPPPEVTPLVAPKEAPAAPPSAPRRPVQPRVTVQPSPGSQLSAALRGSVVGCANPALLSPGERERCLERLGHGAQETPYLPPAIGAAKQAGFDRAGQAKLERRREKEGGVPLGVAGPADSGASYRNAPLDTPVLPPLRP